MSLRNLAKKALPWIALAGALGYLGYTWNWALNQASARHRAHNAFVAGSSNFIFNLCPTSSLKESTPQWATDMRGFCQARQPNWGAEPNQAAALNVESGSKWEAVQLLSKLALEITPGKVLSLITLVVISLAGLLGLQQRGWLNPQGSVSRIKVTRRTAVAMLILVVLALSASLVLLNAQETVTMCQMTGNTYANLLSIDARCSQQTMVLRDTQALLEQKKSELDARAKELDDLKREIASLGAMRDALGTFKAELQNQSASTQQLIMAVTGATLDSISKTVDPLHKDMKGLDQALHTDFKNELRTELQGDMKALVQSDVKAVVQSEVRAALQEELREAVRAAVRSELQDALKANLLASHTPPASAPAQTAIPAKAAPPPAATITAAKAAPPPARPPAKGAPTPAKPTVPKVANPPTVQAKIGAPAPHHPAPLPPKH